jgi:hypothetical protein
MKQAAGHQSRLGRQAESIDLAESNSQLVDGQDVGLCRRGRDLTLLQDVLIGVAADWGGGRRGEVGGWQVRRWVGGGRWRVWGWQGQRYQPRHHYFCTHIRLVMMAIISTARTGSRDASVTMPKPSRELPGGSEDFGGVEVSRASYKH